RTVASRGACAAVIVLALLAGTLGAAEARAERIFLPLDREGAWLAPDKTLHFAASAAIAVSFRVEGSREEAAFRYTIGIGVAKEVFDAAFQPARERRGASRKDLVMDLLGTVAGLALVRALDR
ncbi:MAG TPA: hypothetical protein VFT32_02620, partial [Candidatus Eisenbacteria bacterium]|nr:hypothetical protein [Candidatus Eisenbacteria bacterium]